MRVALLPAGSEDAASSRIRAYTLQRALTQLGVKVDFRYSTNASVLVIQKRITPPIVKIATQAKQNGAAVIYDIDDVGGALGNWVPATLLAELLALTDVVTTDTAGHKDYLQKAYPDTRIAIIPDSVDYYPVQPAHVSLSDSKPLRVLWFGNISNIALFEKYSDFLSALPDIQVVVITGAYGRAGLSDEKTRQYIEKYPKVQFLPWSRKTFVSHLQTCQLTCLMHDGTDIDRAKSNNKLITSITWGVPAVVSNTPEYERTAKESGVGYAVFSDMAGLQQTIDRLRSARARAVYLAEAQPVIWEHYAPEAVAREFLTMLHAMPDRTQKQNLMLDKQAIESLLEPKTMTPPNRNKGFVSTTRTWIKHHMPYQLKSALAPYVPAINQSLLNDPERTRNYKTAWIDPQGRDYRMKVYERQRKGGQKPLESNPTVDEVRSVLRTHAPLSVLEVGCGWGRLIGDLAGEFNVEGCDVSPDMLRLCPPELKVFEYDIATGPNQFVRDNMYHWDILFTRGVLLYLMDSPLKATYALNNMLMLARKKVVIWEWPEVCAYYQQFSDSTKLEFHPIAHQEE